jgi:hypothetical protein
MADTDLASMISQHFQSEGMKRARRQSLRWLSWHPESALLHFCGGLICEGEKSDAVVRMLRQEKMSSIGQRSCLAATGTGENSYGGLYGLDRA